MAGAAIAPERMNKVGGAQEFAPRISEAGRALLLPTHSPAQFLDALTAAGLLNEAVKLFALLLPRREAAWWAAKCVRSIPVAIKDPKALAALEAAEKWIVSPGDDLRRAAFAAAEAAGLGTAAGCVGTAVFFSEGSMGPSNSPSVPALAHLAPGAVANAIILASVVSEPERAGDKLTSFLALAREVAAGNNRWSEPKPTVAPRPVVRSAAPKVAVQPPPPPWRT